MRRCATGCSQRERGREAVAAESDEEQLTPLGIVGVLKIKPDGDERLDRGSICRGSRGKDGLSSFIGLALELFLASLKEGLTVLEFFFKFLELISRLHGVVGGVVVLERCSGRVWWRERRAAAVARAKELRRLGSRGGGLECSIPCKIDKLGGLMPALVQPLLM